MPFKKGETPKGAKPFEKGISGNPLGKPAGIKNRSTVVKRMLEMVGKYPDQVFGQLKEMYPDICQNTTVEEMATIIQINKAISEGDTMAYKAIMDSAYGLPKSEIEHSGEVSHSYINLGSGVSPNEATD